MMIYICFIHVNVDNSTRINGAVYGYEINKMIGLNVNTLIKQIKIILKNSKSYLQDHTICILQTVFIKHLIIIFIYSRSI